MPSSDLVADIGGTNARFAWLDGEGRPVNARTLSVSDYPGLLEAAKAFTQGHEIDRACIAVACPAESDAIAFTNSPWRFSKRALASELRLDHLEVINDFTAVALSTPHLEASDLLRIGGGEPQSLRPMAVLGPGTGLGVSGALFDGRRWVALSGEGGHISFAPNDELEIEILKVLSRRFGRVSVERVLSGSGLENLHSALAEIMGGVEAPLRASEITAQALGDERSLSRSAVEKLCEILGSVAGDVALILGATGGVYIGGGIAPRICEVLEISGFRKRFTDKGRFEAYLSGIPTYVIQAPYPALTGAAAALKSAFVE